MDQTLSTNSYLQQALDVLRGSLDTNECKDFFLPILFLRGVTDNHIGRRTCQQSVHDRLKIPGHTDFFELLAKRGLPGNGSRINTALHDLALANPAQLTGVFEAVDFNSNRLGGERRRDELLGALLERLCVIPNDHGQDDTVEVERKFGRIFSDALEMFGSFGKHHGDTASVPETLANLIAKLVVPREGDRVYDPSCGTGSLLLACAKEAAGNSAESLQLVGHELRGSIWAQARMNLIINCCDSKNIRHAESGRSLRFNDLGRQTERFDIIVSNSSWSIKDRPFEMEIINHHDTHLTSIAPKSSGDYALFLNTLSALDPANGRMAFITTNGTLFRGGKEGEVRQRLLENNLIHAVIALPPKLFMHTGMPFNLLVFKRYKRNSNVVFIDATECHETRRGQNILTQRAIETIVKTYMEEESLPDFSYVASLEEIREQNFTLNVRRFVRKDETRDEESLAELKHRRMRIQSEIVDLEANIRELINAFATKSSLD